LLLQRMDCHHGITRDIVFMVLEQSMNRQMGLIRVTARPALMARMILEPMNGFQ